MDTQEILRRLEFNDGTFPRSALEDAIIHRDSIIPKLLEIIERASQKAEELVEKENYMAHIYAIFLLAQFREKRAYPLIVDFFSIPGRISLDFDWRYCHRRSWTHSSFCVVWRHKSDNLFGRK